MGCSHAHEYTPRRLPCAGEGSGMTDKLQEGEWDTEEETLASRGNGQYEPYLVVSKDEADARVAGLEAENQRLL
jgi:hypothetical protein